MTIVHTNYYTDIFEFVKLTLKSFYLRLILKTFPNLSTILRAKIDPVNRGGGDLSGTQ